MDSTVDPILAIAILVNILKPAIAIRVVPLSPASDSLIRALALVLGIGGELVAGWLTRSLSQASLNDALGRGFGHGVLAILLYHLVASRGPENAALSPAPIATIATIDVVAAPASPPHAGA